MSISRKVLAAAAVAALFTSTGVIPADDVFCPARFPAAPVWADYWQAHYWYRHSHHG